MIRNCTRYNLSDWDSERYVDQLILESDDTYFDCPTIDLEPDLLISKVRQHYMKHMVKLLSVNYETNQKLLNKNIYLPSGIWRCAKIIEMKAAQKSMAIQLYRTQIMSVIKDVKKDTEKGKLYRNLLETMRTPPNDKKTQTSVSTSTSTACDCKCHHHHERDNKRRRMSATLSGPRGGVDESAAPAGPRVCADESAAPTGPRGGADESAAPAGPRGGADESRAPEAAHAATLDESAKVPLSAHPLSQLTTPMHDNDSDAIMMQLEKLFETEHNDDDLFDATFDMESRHPRPRPSTSPSAENTRTRACAADSSSSAHIAHAVKSSDALIEKHAAQIRSLDERLAALTGALVAADPGTLVVADHGALIAAEPDRHRERGDHSKQKQPHKKKIVSKWHCEEYFLKKQLYETLYQIGDTNRYKLSRIKALYVELFGEDEDIDDGVMSPLEESPRLVLSCKTRISMWVLTTLTPYYGMGRIRGKNLFKSVVKYLIDLVFKCKQYPDKREVTDFVKDFIQNHAMITCEADYRDVVGVGRASGVATSAPYTFA